jgi:hypothetical protein
MKKILSAIVWILVLLFDQLTAQPFADIATFSYQTFSSPYKDVDSKKNKTDDYVLNFFVPKEFKNGNVLLVRLNSEYIYSSIVPSSGYAIGSISLPLGFQLVTKDKKWRTVLMAVPKIASDFRDRIDRTDFQMGGIFLQNYVYSDHLKIKAGLYYNREAFGNFFVPLAGIDWQATSRINFYGILPTNYKVEFNLKKNKLYAGFNFKSLTRSFRLSQNENLDYVRYDEMQLKLFIDYFIYKKILLFGEAGYALGKNPLQYSYNTKEQTTANPIFTPVKNGVVFNIGIAYRMRFDLSQQLQK